MGKQGPCSHCGVTSTPLWRNGPPEKPVLCNACGSRWRTKGSLVNYTPLHARSEPNHLDYSKFWKVKTAADLKNKEAKFLKRKSDNNDAAASEVFNHGFSKVFDEDTSNRSSSGSAISNSESFVHDGYADASELTGPSQPVVWDSIVPSRKRTCITRAKPSPVEKLTKDLYTIWHEQQQSSCLSEFSEEDLLLETDKPMVSVEIGHGSVLIKHPNSITQEEESVASSLSFETKQDTVTSMQMILAAPLACTGVDSSNEDINKTRSHLSLSLKDQLGDSQIFKHHNPPLHNIYLQDFKSHNNITESKTVASLDGFGADPSVNMKSPQGVALQNHTGQNVVIRNPRESIMQLPSDQKEVIVKDGNISSSSQLFPPRDNNGYLVMEDSNFAAESSDQDLLLDVPSNGYFPQAELLLPTSRAMF